MNRPPEAPPPYGALIEAAREDAGLSRREAAKRAGISDSWWRYVAAGWQNGPVTGSAKVVAAMARAVGVTPEQLEGDGERPDAARVLRRAIEAPPPLRPVPEPQPDSPSVKALADLLAAYPDDEVIRAMSVQRHKEASAIVAEIYRWLDFLAVQEDRGENGASAGLPGDDPKETLRFRADCVRSWPVIRM